MGKEVHLRCLPNELINPWPHFNHEQFQGFNIFGRKTNYTVKYKVFQNKCTVKINLNGVICADAKMNRAFIQLNFSRTKVSRIKLYMIMLWCCACATCTFYISCCYFNYFFGTPSYKPHTYPCIITLTI